MPATTDRRVRRTRTLLVQALVSLILERGYARITVQDILDRADVGRFDLLRALPGPGSPAAVRFDGLRRICAATWPGTGRARASRAGASRQRGLRARAHQAPGCLPGSVRAQGGTIVSGHLHDVLSDSISADLAAAGRDLGPRLPAEIRAEHAVSALLGLLTWWVARTSADGPAEMACMYGLLATAALTA